MVVLESVVSRVTSEIRRKQRGVLAGLPAATALRSPAPSAEAGALPVAEVTIVCSTNIPDNGGGGVDGTLRPNRFEVGD